MFVDDFTHDGQWVKDADNSRRCRFQYPSDETLQLAKGGKGFFDPKEAGLLCVATPTDDSLDLNLVADTRLGVTVVTDEAAAGDRVGFVRLSGGDRSLPPDSGAGWHLADREGGRRPADHTLSFARTKGPSRPRA